MKKYLPVILLVLGFLLVVGAGILAMTGGLTPKNPVTSAEGVPPTLIGVPLSDSQSGQEAIAAIQQLHNVNIPIKNAVTAVYGQGSANLWVAELDSSDLALQLVQSMENSIGSGTMGFTPKGVFQFRNRDIYMMESTGKSHFFMQAGSKVIWVTTSPEQAEQAMKEALDFYP